MSTEPLTATTLQDAYRSGRLRPTEVVAGCLERALDPAAQGVFITLTAQRAMREAARSEARWRSSRPLSPLDGVPVSWKDMIDVEGVATTAGSRLMQGAPASRDAEIVERLTRAGAVCIGKTNLSEFAFSGLGMNPWYGTPVNPRSSPDVPRVCGGSSSGAAASVDRGLCALAMGTDTSGSVRIPAAFTGLVGWKPGRGSWPAGGVRSLAPSLDALGVIAHHVQDALLVHQALAAPPAAGPAIRRIVVDERLLDASDPAPRVNALAALDAARRCGIAVEQCAVPELEAVSRLFEAHGTLVAAEAYRRYEALLARPEAERMDPLVRQRLADAARITPAHLQSLRRGQARLRSAIARHWPETAFAFPTAPITAPAIAQVLEPAAYRLANARALSHTMLASYLDMPGMALPTGVDAAGLPTSLLLSAPAGQEEALLRLCQQWPCRPESRLAARTSPILTAPVNHH